MEIAELALNLLGLAWMASGVGALAMFAKRRAGEEAIAPARRAEATLDHAARRGALRPGAASLASGLVGVLAGALLVAGSGLAAVALVVLATLQAASAHRLPDGHRRAAWIAAGVTLIVAGAALGVFRRAWWPL